MIFEPYFIRNKKYFNNLIWKLRHILSANPNLDKFKYDGVKCLTERYPQIEQVGILVDGLDAYGVRDFQRFYSVKDIHFLFGQLQRRMDYSR